MRIAVNTPSGNIGRRVVEQLLAANALVTLISRHPAKVADFVGRGAQLVEGSIDDPIVVGKAFDGADAVFWLTPFAPEQTDYMDWARRTGRMAAAAVKRTGVKSVVLISSIGAQYESGVGPIGCLPAIEGAFKEAAPNVTALRAASFMENYLGDVGTIAKMCTIFSPLHPETKIPRVATRDIAAKAVEAILNPNWTGFRIIGVHGPEDLTPSRAAEIIGQGIGRPVKCVEVSVQQAKDGMLKAGVPPFMVELLGDMYEGFRAGRMVSAEPRTPETTTETSLLEFSRLVLKPAVDAAARG